MSSRQYFGTDGIRGAVGKPPMTPEFALKLGWAAGRVLAGGHDAYVLIGKDTRRSGYLFESALEAGLSAAGVRVGLLGPLPTPGVAYLARELAAQAGVVISASHNPHHDNGVKFFSSEGDKLSDEVELEIERLMTEELSCVPAERLGLVRRVTDAQSRYADFCASTYRGPSLARLHIVLDCAHGAAYQVGPEVLRRLGARLTVIGDRPDGFNINRDCGSTHMQTLCDTVRRERADLGIAFDGDADRCLMSDERGRIVDGDEILYLIARHRAAAGRLHGPVIGTQMSNLGLEVALKALGIPFGRAKVGDRYVVEMMRERGAELGGETSGHTLCLDRATTGDGIITALQILEIVADGRRPLSEWVEGMHKYPQVLINVPVAGAAAPVLKLPQVRSALKAGEASLQERGRILLRASGTEPLIRVMVEAENEDETRSVAEALAEQVRRAAAW